jgi:hypothetical protein
VTGEQQRNSYYDLHLNKEIDNKIKENRGKEEKTNH